MVEDNQSSPGRSLADIIKKEGESKDDVKDVLNRGVHKRPAEDGEEDEEGLPKKRAAWGSRLKTYPGRDVEGEEEDGDLDALLSGVTRKKQPVINEEKSGEEDDVIKREDSAEERKTLAAVPDINAPTATVKQEDADGEALTPVVFKKRKAKR